MALSFCPISEVPLGALAAATNYPSVETDVAVTGLAATAALGSITSSAKATAMASTLTATGYVGTATTSYTGSVTLSGLQASALLGHIDSILVGGALTYYVTSSLVAQSSIGTTSVVVSVRSVTTAASGVEATSAVGDVTVSGADSVYPYDVVGVEATCIVTPVAITNSGSVVIPGLEAAVPAPGGFHAVPSSYGSNTSNLGPSLWTPVNPTG